MSCTGIAIADSNMRAGRSTIRSAASASVLRRAAGPMYGGFLVTYRFDFDGKNHLPSRIGRKLPSPSAAGRALFEAENLVNESIGRDGSI